MSYASYYYYYATSSRIVLLLSCCHAWLNGTRMVWRAVITYIISSPSLLPLMPHFTTYHGYVALHIEQASTIASANVTGCHAVGLLHAARRLLSAGLPQVTPATSRRQKGDRVATPLHYIHMAAAIILQLRRRRIFTLWFCYRMPHRACPRGERHAASLRIAHTTPYCKALI